MNGFVSPPEGEMNMLGHPNSFQPRILVSDVNETLLEVDALRPHFQRIFGTSEVLRHWFSQTLLYSQTLTLIGKYADFHENRPAIVRDDCAESFGPFKRRRRLLDPVRHENAACTCRCSRIAAAVAEGWFPSYRSHKFAQAIVEQQMRAAGLAAMFERIIAVDIVKKYEAPPGCVPVRRNRAQSGNK